MRRCTVLLALLLCVLLPAKAEARPVKFYLGGWTRTTWYVPYSPPNPTASGRWPQWGMLAAPKGIPFGARVTVPGLGTFVVADRGSAIWGNHLDIFMPWPGYRHVNDYYRGVYWTY